MASDMPKGMNVELSFCPLTNKLVSEKDPFSELMLHFHCAH